jgi:large subunit ribosomal protein L4e
MTGKSYHRNIKLGNMCRGGRMFAPTKTFRRWHRKINITQKRQAVASCLAASGSAPLIDARGHRISEKVKEIPIVVEGLEKLQQTKQAITCLTNLGLKEELDKCRKKHLRSGKGKMRGRRYKYRCGPLIVYEKNQKIVETFRNIPGVNFCKVNALNLLQLAPGGHVGRLIIWTKKAFSKLNNWLDGKKSPKMIMMNSDLQSLINSDEIQSVIREPRKNSKIVRKRNLLGKNKIRYETFRGFSLQEVNRRKYKSRTTHKESNI